MPPAALTIAASDPLGGAGVQADLATFASLGVHGTSALHAVPAQALQAVTAVDAVTVAVIAAQSDAVGTEMHLTAVKTGLLRRGEVVGLVAERVQAGALPAPVVDPVMVNGRGERFVTADTEDAYREHLFPLARVITPNRAEAELLVGEPLPSAAAVLDCADALRGLGAGAVIVTGGGFDGQPDDVVIPATGDPWVEAGRRVSTANVRGSGCTFSAALAAGFATGLELTESVKQARSFVHAAITAAAAWRYHGTGPVSHTRR